MKGTFTYQCQDCEALLTRLPKGVCPYCGSHATLSLDWYRVSPAERRSWFNRIHGQLGGTPREQLASLRPSALHDGL